VRKNRFDSLLSHLQLITQLYKIILKSKRKGQTRLYATH